MLRQNGMVLGWDKISLVLLAKLVLLHSRIGRTMPSGQRLSYLSTSGKQPHSLRPEDRHRAVSVVSGEAEHRTHGIEPILGDGRSL
jgi:hypothetical protein